MAKFHLYITQIWNISENASKISTRQLSGAAVFSFNVLEMQWYSLTNNCEIYSQLQFLIFLEVAKAVVWDKTRFTDMQK